MDTSILFPNELGCSPKATSPTCLFGELSWSPRTLWFELNGGEIPLPPQPRKAPQCSWIVMKAF